MRIREKNEEELQAIVEEYETMADHAVTEVGRKGWQGLVKVIQRELDSARSNRLCGPKALVS